MADEILAEHNEGKETIMTRKAEFEQHRAESERRNRSIKSFATSLGEFLGDTKCKLLKMVTQYDEAESQRIQLGPLMPAGRVTLESFGTLADTFMQGCMALMEEAAQHWQTKGAAQVQEQARKLEA
jgi:hypothetical protein